jgi:hypothetical protein
MVNTSITTPSRSFRTALAAVAVVAALVLGGSIAPISPAAAQSQVEASVAATHARVNCSNGACTVYLNRAETLALSQGRVPNINLGVLTIPFRVLALGHVWVAKGWVSRGYCVAFTLNIRPWKPQGMTGAYC